MAKSKNRAELLAEFRQFKNNYDNRGYDSTIQDCGIDSSASTCCGIAEIFGLYCNPKLSAKDQAKALYANIHSNGCTAGFITDTLSSKNWEITKKYAKRSAVVTNKNSGNKIALWYITPRVLNDIYCHGS